MVVEIMGKRKLIMAIEEAQKRIEECLSSEDLRLNETGEADIAYAVT